MTLLKKKDIPQHLGHSVQLDKLSWLENKRVQDFSFFFFFLFLPSFQTLRPRIWLDQISQGLSLTIIITADQSVINALCSQCLLD